MEMFEMVIGLVLITTAMPASAGSLGSEQGSAWETGTGAFLRVYGDDGLSPPSCRTGAATRLMV
jgi:hypothetical protein